MFPTILTLSFIVVIGIDLAVAHISLRMVWHARSGCPEHHIDAVERAANAMSPLWRTTPVSGEHFESIVECERRVRGLAFVEVLSLSAMVEATHPPLAVDSLVSF